MTTTGEVRLADFGSAKIREESIDKDAVSGTYSYTPLWVAPETLNARKYDEKVDIWVSATTECTETRSAPTDLAPGAEADYCVLHALPAPDLPFTGTRLRRDRDGFRKGAVSSFQNASRPARDAVPVGSGAATAGHRHSISV